MEIATVKKSFLQEDSGAGAMLKNFVCYQKIPLSKMEVVEGEVSYTENLVKCVVPNVDGFWIEQPQEEVQRHIGQKQWQCENFVETDDGIFSLRDGEIDKKIMDAHIRIVRIEKIVDGNEAVTFLICQVTILWNGKISEIKINEKNFLNLFAEIRQKFPEIKFYTTSPEILKQYLAEIYRRDIGQANKTFLFVRSGWHETNNSLTYDIGCDDFYKTVSVPPVDVEWNIYYIFEHAWQFWGVGKCGETISLIWLMAHMGFTNYFFNKADCRFSSILFVKGATGLLKTSAVKVVANPFDKNRDNATIRLTSTQASIGNVMKLTSDSLLIVDDFSNTEVSSKRKAIENAEWVIRAIGDGIFPAKQELKRDIKDYSKTLRESVKCVVILTGEDSLNLGRSSQLRMIEVEVNTETFDGRKLHEFQKNPQIMAQYFALYLKFLQENNVAIVEHIRQKFSNYRDDFEKNFSIRRLSESASILQIQIEILSDFARFCCQNQDRIMRQQEMLSHNLLAVINQNQKIGSSVNPTLKFLEALYQTLNTENAKIAETEEIYVNAEEKFVGFREGNRIWIRPNDAMQIVQKYYRNLGENFLPSLDEIKKKLLIEGFSEGVLPKNGSGGEYVCRAKKGSRKRMLVLKTEVIENALENFKEEF